MRHISILVLALVFYSHYGVSQSESVERTQEELFDQEALDALGEELKEFAQEGEILSIDEDVLNSAGRTLEKLAADESFLFKMAVVSAIESLETVNEALGFDHLDTRQARIIALPAWVGFGITSYYASRWLLSGVSAITPDKKESWRKHKAHFKALSKELVDSTDQARDLKQSLDDLKKSFSSKYVGLSQAAQDYLKYSSDQSVSQLLRSRWEREALRLARIDLNNPNLTLNELREGFRHLSNQSSKIKSTKNELRRVNNRINSIDSELQAGLKIPRGRGFFYRIGRLFRGFGSLLILTAGVSSFAVLTADMLLIEFSSIEEMSRVKDQYTQDLSYLTEL